jgi:hypothetical protein
MNPIDRVTFIEHRGVRILHADFSGIRETPEFQRAIRLATELTHAQPLHSLLILADVTGVEYSLETFAIAQQAVVANRPYVRARAIVGVPRVASVPFDVVAKLSGAPMARFPDLDAAKDWLSEHA